MEPLLETIDLDMEEANELLFRVKVEGAEQAPAKVRLVCESGDLAFMFNGRVAGPDGLIQFNLPVMRDKLKEGLYQSRVEVLIENRYFAPVQFQVNFKKAVKVVAEAVNVAPRKVAPEITVTAAPVVKPKPVPPPPPKPEREAPPPARQSAQVTLKERYHAKKDELLTERGEPNEDAILEAARQFVKERRKK
jgi:hypothetical protein